MIIAISGYIGSGKDTVAQMINYMLEQYRIHGQLHHPFNPKGDYTQVYEIKKFAAKLKQIASLLTGISVEKFEDQEFKNTELSREWWYWADRRDMIARVPSTDETDALLSKSTGMIQLWKPIVRQFLQELGTEAIRNQIHTNAWVNALFAEYKPIPGTEVRGIGLKHGPQFPNWIISDVRYPNEAKAVKDSGGVIWRINRPPSSIYVSRGPDDIQEVPFDSANKVHTDLYEEERLRKHPSETSLDDWPFDAVINNSGTLEDLLVQVQTLLKTQHIL